jgi:hypothetical protein
MSKSWLHDASNSNIFKQSYMKNFLDVSGDIYIRNGNIIATNDISMNGNIVCNALSLTVPYSSSGVNPDVLGSLNLKQNTLIAGLGITIEGTVINATATSAISTITSDGTTINVNSDTNVSGDLNVVGNLSADGVLLHTSDDRLKVNEEYIENALDTLENMTPVKYIINNKTETGFIAQDVWYNTPELRHIVSTNSSNILDSSGSYTYETDLVGLGWSDIPAQLNYIGICGHITKSIQELNALIENNKTKINNIV